MVAGERRRYDYPRWQFVNHSDDTRRLCCRALEVRESRLALGRPYDGSLTEWVAAGLPPARGGPGPRLTACTLQRR